MIFDVNAVDASHVVLSAEILYLFSACSDVRLCSYVSAEATPGEPAVDNDLPAAGTADFMHYAELRDRSLNASNISLIGSSY